MNIKVNPIDDVTREIEIEFQDGSTRGVNISVREVVPNGGTITHSRRLADILYIKVGVPSDFVANLSDNDRVEMAIQEEDTGWTATNEPIDLADLSTPSPAPRREVRGGERSGS